MWRLVLVLFIGFFSLVEGRDSNYQVDEKYMVDGVYRGRFCPPAEYVLSGQFAKDMEPLPKVPWRYLNYRQGYRQDVMSPVPPPGVHPRVLMDMGDIKKIREKIKLGKEAPRYFQIQLNWAKNQRDDLVSRSFMALVLEDEVAGRKCVDELIALAKEQEPLIDLLNNHPTFAGIRDNYYYFSRSEVVSVGGVPYKKAYREGGAKRIHELAKIIAVAAFAKLDARRERKVERVCARANVASKKFHKRRRNGNGPCFAFDAEFLFTRA